MRIAPILAVVVLVAGAAGGYAYWLQDQASRVPAGLARANGRIEVERVDVATKYAGRIADLRVDEGAFVQKNDVLVRIDTTELLAQLAAARAAVHRTHQSVARAQADVAIREAELKLAEVDLNRVVELARTNTATQAELDRRTAQRDISKATLDSARVAIEDAKAATEAAEAQVALVEATIADMTLKSPVSGRVEYRLAQAGDLPPLKWSSLKYGFDHGGYDGEEETYGGRDRCEASAGRCVDGAGPSGGGRGPGDRRDGSNVLSMAQ